MTKRLLFFILLVASFAFGQAPVTGSITASGSSCGSTNCVQTNPLSQAIGAVTIQVSGTFSATLQFEASNDGITWASVAALPSSDPTSPATSTTSTGLWQVSAGGYSAIRVRASAYASGTAVVRINSSNASARNGGGGGGGGGNTTSTSLVSGNITQASGTHSIVDSGIAASSLAVPGQITVVHSNGTQTIYNPAANTDAARGTALKAAQAAAVDGDSIFTSGSPSAGYYMGDCSTNAIGSTSANKCVDLSLGGTGSVNLYGAGKGVAPIYTDWANGNQSIIVQMGATSEVGNVYIKSTVSPGTGTAHFISPIGTTGYDGGAGHGIIITNGHIYNSYIVGVSDLFAGFNLPSDCSTFNVLVENSTAVSQWDTWTATCTTPGWIYLRNVDSTSNEAAANASVGTCYKGAFNFDITNSTCTGTTGGTGFQGVSLGSGGTVNLRSGYITVSGSGTKYALSIQSGATVHAAPGFGYDPSQVSNSGTLDYSPTNQNQFFGALPTGVTGTAGKVVLDTSPTISNLTVTGSCTGCGSGSPGGADTNVQYNDGGAFGGSSEFLWNKTTKILSLGIDGTTAGKLQLSNNAAAFHTTITTGATANWTFQLPTNVFTTNHVFCGSTLSTQMTLADCGFVASAGNLSGIGTLATTGQLSVNGNQVINSSGLTTTDDGITTAGLGHPIIIATYDATNLTATSGPNTLLASAPAGFYKMEAYLYTTTSNGTSTMTVTPNWNDGVASHTNTSNTCSAAGNNFVVSQTPFYVAAGQTIAWTNTLSGTIGSATYGLHIVLWRVN